MGQFFDGIRVSYQQAIFSFTPRPRAIETGANFTYFWEWGMGNRELLDRVFLQN